MSATYAPAATALTCASTAPAITAPARPVTMRCANAHTAMILAPTAHVMTAHAPHASTQHKQAGMAFPPPPPPFPGARGGGGGGGRGGGFCIRASVVFKVYRACVIVRVI